MGQPIDLTNERFGNLIVINRGKPKNYGNRTMITWFCQCDCGNTITTVQQSLKSSRVISCGCIRKKRSAEAQRKRRKDISGKRFGYITAIERYGVKGHNSSWLCLCDCGQYTVVRMNNLLSGNTTRCNKCWNKTKGLKIRKDISGNKYGKLTAVKQIEVKSKYSYYTCLCDCGSVVTTTRNHLERGHTRSCGCLDNCDARYHLSYTVWRNAVVKRDKFTCQICGHYNESNHAHHIFEWSLYPEYRYEEMYGITLCYECHKESHYGTC